MKWITVILALLIGSVAWAQPDTLTTRLFTPDDMIYRKGMYESYTSAGGDTVYHSFSPIDVRQYGVEGDGTDVSDEFAALMDSVAAWEGRVFLYFPEPDSLYNITGVAIDDTTTLLMGAVPDYISGGAPRQLHGTGSPTMYAPVGSIYQDGAASGDSALYIKASGDNADGWYPAFMVEDIMEIYSPTYLSLGLSGKYSSNLTFLTEEADTTRFLMNLDYNGNMTFFKTREGQDGIGYIVLDDDYISVARPFVSGYATLSQGDPTPDVSDANFFLTANIDTVKISTFEGGFAGQRIEILILDGYTSFVETENGNIRVRGDIYGEQLGYISFYHYGDTWYELSRQGDVVEDDPVGPPPDTTSPVVMNNSSVWYTCESDDVYLHARIYTDEPAKMRLRYSLDSGATYAEGDTIAWSAEHVSDSYDLVSNVFVDIDCGDLCSAEESYYFQAQAIDESDNEGFWAYLGEITVVHTEAFTVSAVFGHIIEDGELTITGSGFGTGPTVHMFDDFQAHPDSALIDGLKSVIGHHPHSWYGGGTPIRVRTTGDNRWMYVDYMDYPMNGLKDTYFMDGSSSLMEFYVEYDMVRSYAGTRPHHQKHFWIYSDTDGHGSNPTSQGAGYAINCSIGSDYDNPTDPECSWNILVGNESGGFETVYYFGGDGGNCADEIGVWHHWSHHLEHSAVDTEDGYLRITLDHDEVYENSSLKTREEDRRTTGWLLGGHAQNEGGDAITSKFSGYDNVYIASNPARVYITDAATLSGSTVAALCPDVESWSNSSIAVTDVRTYGFEADDTCYVIVVNEDGTESSWGPSTIHAAPGVDETPPVFSATPTITFPMHPVSGNYMIRVRATCDEEFQMFAQWRESTGDAWAPADSTNSGYWSEWGTVNVDETAETTESEPDSLYARVIARNRVGLHQASFTLLDSIEIASTEEYHPYTWFFSNSSTMTGIGAYDEAVTDSMWTASIWAEYPDTTVVGTGFADESGRCDVLLHQYDSQEDYLPIDSGDDKRAVIVYFGGVAPAINGIEITGAYLGIIADYQGAFLTQAGQWFSIAALHKNGLSDWVMSAGSPDEDACYNHYDHSDADEWATAIEELTEESDWGTWRNYNPVEFYGYDANDPNHAPIWFDVTDQCQAISDLDDPDDYGGFMLWGKDDLNLYRRLVLRMHDNAGTANRPALMITGLVQSATPPARTAPPGDGIDSLPPYGQPKKH